MLIDNTQEAALLDHFPELSTYHFPESCDVVKNQSLS